MAPFQTEVSTAGFVDFHLDPATVSAWFSRAEIPKENTGVVFDRASSKAEQFRVPFDIRGQVYAGIVSMQDARTWSINLAGLSQLINGPGNAAKELDRIKCTRWLNSLDEIQGNRDWSHVPQPSEDAFALSRKFITLAMDCDRWPSRISPTMVGGIGVTFGKGARKAYVEFRNTGNIHSLLSNGDSDPIVSKVDPSNLGFRKLVQRISFHLT